MCCFDGDFWVFLALELIYLRVCVFKLKTKPGFLKQIQARSWWVVVFFCFLGVFCLVYVFVLSVLYNFIVFMVCYFE